MPNLGFEGGLEYTDEWAERDEFREKNPSWWIGAKIELPLFLGGSRVRERNALKAELGSRQFLRDDAALETANDVRVETEALLSNAYRFPPTARAAERAQEYFDLVLSDYTVGRRTVAEMYDALANVRTSALDAIAIESAYFRSTARLTYLIGLAPHEHGNTPGQQLILLLRAAGQ
jgi:outer membrane protein TolC